MEYNPGDYIWLYITNLKLLPGLSYKLTALWIGPYEVTAKISAVAYHLCLTPELAIHNVLHASLLKPHHGSVPFHPASIVVADIDAVEF